MKNAQKQALKGLPVRMLVPVVVITAMVGAGLYFFVLRSVSEFSDRQIRGALTKTSRDLYNVCDGHFSELMRSGRIGYEAAVRIQKARALGAIEDFVQRNRIGCLLVDAGTETFLLSHAVPEEVEGRRCAVQTAVPFQTILSNGKLYYLSHFEFSPWNWHVDLYMDTAEYAPLIRRVRIAYAVTGLLLLLSAFFLLIFFDRLLRKPINRIILAVQSGRAPEYHGSYELEFLSDTIRGMMHSLKDRTAWLERLYSIALTERGDAFFRSIAESVAYALGLHVIIVRQYGDEETSPTVAGSRIDEPIPSYADCLEGLPLEKIQRGKQPIVLPFGALERFPRSPCLQAVSAEAYLGLPVFNRQGEITGSIHAFGRPREFDDWDMNLLKTAGQMAAAEFDLIEKEKEKESYQEQMFRSQKLESLGILAGGVAHDFNNLLMGIQGRTSLMLADGKASQVYIEHLRAIEEYVESATDLTQQLLGFARGGKYDVRPADMNTVLDQSARMFGRTKKEIRICRNFQPGLWSVEIDRSQVEQVLLNLYVNAWHAMPGGGELVLGTGNVDLDEDQAGSKGLSPGRYVVISVSDTGVGMDETTLEKIFDPFFTTKGMGRGSGLGLASAYGIVQNHRGFIEVQSLPGKGSTFTIFLPASGKEIVEVKDGGEASVRGTETILIVDDEEMILEVGGRMLESLGYQVLTAGNGQEALNVYSRRFDSIGMVILDMIMPNMGGGETYQRLKKIDPEVRVILCSGYSMDVQARGILQQGCNGFIQKPFKLNELSRKVRGILDAAGREAEG